MKRAESLAGHEWNVFIKMFLNSGVFIEWSNGRIVCLPNQNTLCKSSFLCRSWKVGQCTLIFNNVSISSKIFIE